MSKYAFTLPRFSYRAPPTSKPDSNRAKSLFIGGYVCFLVGSALFIFGTMGALLPCFVLGGVFFGFGILSLRNAYLLVRK